MTQKNDKVKIQEEREKRLQQVAQLEYIIAKKQQRLVNDRETLLKLIGALEQLDELEGTKTAVPSNDGAPQEILAKPRILRDSVPPKAGKES